MRIVGHMRLDRLETEGEAIRYCHHQVAVTRWTAATKEEVQEALYMAVG